MQTSIQAREERQEGAARSSGAAVASELPASSLAQDTAYADLVMHTTIQAREEGQEEARRSSEEVFASVPPPLPVAQ